MTAFEYNSLLTEMKEPLFYFSAKFYKSLDDREDLTQDTLIKALLNKDKFNTGTNIKAWLFTIMRNIFINEYQKNKRMRESMNVKNNLSDVNNETPQDILEVQDINSNISKLEDKYRVPLTMYNAGYKYKEIADEINLPIGTVKNRIHSARHILVNKFN